MTQKQYNFQALRQGYEHKCHQTIAAEVALWSGTTTVCNYIDGVLITAASQQEIEAAAKFLKVRLQD